MKDRDRGLWGCRRALVAAVVAAPLTAQCGCLSLGGRTTYVNESPETISRIESLEFRVSTLERMMSPPAAPAERIYEGLPTTAPPNPAPPR